MPRPISQQIVGSDAASVRRPQEAVLTPQGAPVNTFVQPQDSEFDQLAKGLGALHEPLARLQHEHDSQQRKADILAAQERAAKATDPATADATDLIDRTPPAWRQDVQMAFQEGIGHRIGVNAKQEFLDEYTKASRDPGFNLDKFAAEFRAKNVTGLQGAMATNAAAQIDGAIAEARGEQRRLQEKRYVEGRSANLNAALGAINPESPQPDQMAAFQSAADVHVRSGGTRAEAAKAYLENIVAASSSRGGRPDLFSVFDQEVPGLGMKLSDVAGLRDNVAKAKQQAELQLKHSLHDNTTVIRAEQLDGINTMLNDGTAVKMGREGFATYLKQFISADGTGAVTTESYVSHLAAFDKAMAAEHDKAYTADMLAKGLGGLLPPTKAKAVLGQALDQGGAMAALGEAITDPKANPELLSGAVNGIVAAHSRTGVAFPDDRLKAVIDSVVNEVPKEGADVSPRFQALAKVYAGMERQSKPLLNAYFDDKTRALFSEYNRATVEGSMPSNAAYHQAYAMVDPDNIKAAEERVQKDPAFRAELTDRVRSSMRGLFAPGHGAWSPRFWPLAETFGVRPQTGAMEAWGQSMALSYAKMNPNRSADEIAKYVSEQTESNWYFEAASKSYIQVPPKFNNDGAREAIGGYLSAVKGNNPELNVDLVSKGNGHYTLMAFPSGSTIGAPLVDDVSLDSMLALRTAQKGLTDQDYTDLRGIRQKIEGGTATPEDLKGSEFVLAKARSLGLWKPALQQKAEQLSAKATAERSLTELDGALKTAFTRGEYKPSEAVKPKGTLTAPAAQEFVKQGDLAGALTVMAEGISTKAYKDSRGTSIGVGYNMDANAKTLADDFRRAGIPPEQADAIKAGKVHITVDQAMRLYQAVKPRYEAAAKAAVDEKYPGEWPKLGDNVKAVLTDLAYQTGPAGVKTFKDGLSRIFQGDLSGTGLEVTYLKPGTSERVTDVRRHTLRTAMLRNTTSFQTLLSHASKQPANALQTRIAGAGAP